MMSYCDIVTMVESWCVEHDKPRAAKLEFRLPIERQFLSGDRVFVKTPYGMDKATVLGGPWMLDGHVVYEVLACQFYVPRISKSCSCGSAPRDEWFTIGAYSVRPTVSTLFLRKFR